jgi:outer membrane immunogenic protein
MKLKLGFLIASVFLIGSFSTASAADFSVKAPSPATPAWFWSGSYVGINGGWIQSSSNTLTNVATDAGTAGLGTGLAVGAIPFAVTGFRETGGMVGGTAGYNWQSAGWVFGLEGDVDWVSAKVSANTGFISVGGSAPIETTYSRGLDWLATFRGRVGFLATPSFLLYGTAGGAVGQTKIGNQFICPTCVPASSTQANTVNTNTATAGGWTAGAGFEWIFAPQWSFKAEYLYVDLGNHSSTITYNYGPGGTTGTASSLTSTVKDTYNIVRVGVNYQFGGPVVANY